MKTKSIIFGILLVLFVGFSYNGISQSVSTNSKFSLNLDGGGYLSINKKIGGGVVGINLQSRNKKFGLNTRLKYQYFYSIPNQDGNNYWLLGFAEFSYKITKLKKFPFKVSLGLGPVSSDIYLFSVEKTNWGLGSIITASIQKEVKNFEFEFRVDKHTIDLFHPNNTIYVNGNTGTTLSWKYNFTFGVIYRFHVLEF